MIFETLHSLGYGELHFAHDVATGMRAVIALHSTKLGPAIGGLRVRKYESEADAIDDVTRLAQGMTYKNALAGLPHGGGKSVMLAPDGIEKFSPAERAALFKSFATFLHGLGGRYLAAEDSGTSASDMDVMREVTPHVLGASQGQGGSGDPSPFTALGVFRGIEAIAHNVFSRSDLAGMHVAIQGVGHVGMHLARLLHKAGATLTITDVDRKRLDQVASETGARVVPTDSILETECDILAPCAFGGAITEALVPKLKCRAVAGAANNQLRTKAAGDLLAQRGIFYAPDYVINAGGVINVAQEFVGYDESKSTPRVLAIYDTIRQIIERSKSEKRNPELIADQIAEEIIARGRS